MDISLTLIIILITAVISVYAMSQRDVLYKFMMNPYMVVHRGQYYRMITSGFIHQDYAHLILNMISLYFFGRNLEYHFTVNFGTLGPVYFVLLYILGVIVSDVPTLFKHRNNPGYNSLGASGAVSAVVFACILFDPLMDLYLYFAIPIKGFIFAALYIIYSYTSSKRSRDNINHDAHLYGALFGLVFCIVLYPKSVSLFIEKIKAWQLF